MMICFASSRPLSLLNDDIAFSMHWMRGQMVCYAEIRAECEAEELRIVWQFCREQMRNCGVGMGRKD